MDDIIKVRPTLPSLETQPRGVADAHWLKFKPPNLVGTARSQLIDPSSILPIQTIEPKPDPVDPIIKPVLGNHHLPVGSGHRISVYPTSFQYLKMKTLLHDNIVYSTLLSHLPQLPFTFSILDPQRLELRNINAISKTQIRKEVVLPCNQSGNHWVLVTAALLAEDRIEISVRDSFNLTGKPDPELVNRVTNYMGIVFPHKTITKVELQRTTRQKNGYDCSSGGGGGGGGGLF
ncbi:hypothetical protein BP5796_01978 [Coleophoma crateriformis]|uniref:Ubiquitin-like protease family profile domain-containing protein n=1 Tax=Coleophoma crateriformis TaxID=565419 RepID=A0A3D8T216_9HELO|nr:hypothetical protein BP5796_01978 [Coleophoma crateriformis]